MQPHLSYRDSGSEWIGEIPAHWRVMPLGRLASYRASSVDKKSNADEIPVRLCNYTDVYYGERIRAGAGGFMAATATAHEVNRFGLRHGDVIITKDSEDWQDIGVPALVEESAEDFVCGYHLGIVRPGGDVDPGYLFYALASDGVNKQLQVAATGATRYGIPNGAVECATIPLPPLDEQRRIAEVLDAAEDAIRLSERVIAKQQWVRSGLAFDLLRGNVSAIPGGTESLHQLSRGNSRRAARLGTYVRLNTTHITPAAFPHETFDHYSIPAFDAHGRAEAALGAEIESGKTILSRPAVLVSKLNPRRMRVQQYAGQGNSMNRAVASTEFMAYEPKSNSGVSLDFLANLLNGDEFARRLQATATGTTNSHVRAQPRETLDWPVRIPPTAQQRRIADVLGAADDAIRTEENRLYKLRELRAGLSSDLLSGRVRTVAA